MERLAEARARAKAATGVDKVLAAQDVRDLQTRIANMNDASGSDIKSLEAAFVKIAKRFGENRGIGYGAWRDAGVPATVLKKAGVARTRGWSPEDLLRRENLQWPLDRKRQISDYVIQNTADAGDARRQVREVFSRILARASHTPEPV